MLGGQHVLGFSPDGKLFALINDQGILRIWDTDTNELKQEYTPNLHLAGPCTALAWFAAAIQNRKESKKTRKSNTNNATTLFLILGTSTGHVSLYSYAEGKIERNLKGEGHNGKITAMTLDNTGNLYTCGEDCQVIVWSLAEEKRISAWSIGTEKPYSLAFVQHSNNLVIGARQIKVYSLETRELVQTFVGHTSEVSLMSSFAIDGSVEYAVTTSPMERIICLWKIGTKGRNKTATCTLLMEDIAHCLCCQLDNERNLHVASVTRSGVIHVYLIPVDSIKAEKPVKPKVTIEIASESASIIAPIPAFAASWKHSRRFGELLFAYGDKHFMIFENVMPNFAEKMQVLLRKDPKKLNMQKTSAKKEHGATLFKTVTPIVQHSDVDYKSTISATRKPLKTIEMPMEARLQNLNLSTASGSATGPQALSKVKLLVQALHSKDAALLRTVLCTDDTKMIQLTLHRLPVQYVGTLVNELTHLMEKKRNNVEFAINWLKTLAQTHASQLMAMGSDELLHKFGPCIGIIEHRANCLMELSKLNGRLQLLVSQIKRSAEDDNHLNSENTVIYEDNDDSSNSEPEGEGAERHASDGEWEEDNDDDVIKMEQDDDDDDEDDKDVDDDSSADEDEDMVA